MRPSPAETLLQELGVTDPAEINLEAVAHHVNAQVRYRPLDGCEARIVGAADSAIITVNRGQPVAQEAVFHRARAGPLAPPSRPLPRLPS